MERPGRIVACCGAGAAALCGVLREAGFGAVEADPAARRFGEGADILLLDGSLPGAAELCTSSRLPVIEVVNGSPHERADAYLTLPVAPAVLAAAVNAVIRRNETAKRSEELLRGILEHAPAAIYSSSAEGKYTLVNRAWETLTGRRREQTLGRSFEEVWLAGLAHTFREGNRRVLETGAPITEIQAVETPAGRRLFHTVKFPVLDESGRVDEIAGMSFDITEQERAEEALRAREEHLRVALESASMGAWCYTLSTREFVASPQAKAMHGLPPGEPVTVETAVASFHPEDRQRMLAELRGLTAAGDQLKAEYRTLRPDGTVRSIVAQGSLVVDPETGLRRIFGVLQDVTEWKRLEERLLENRKLEAVGRLAAGLAHRLNNSLTEVLGHIGIALDSLPGSSPLRGPLDTAALACNRMAGLTRDLLAYAGKPCSFVRPVDLSRLIAAEPLAQLLSPKVRLKLELQHDLPPLRGDAVQLARLAVNLVANGAEAIGTDTPGTVTVAVTGRELRAEDLEGFLGREELRPGRYVCLRITDSGSGMDPATLPLIFDPFFSTRFMGRGLGLAAVLGAVRRHRGGIRVESAPGQGTSVTICLPAPPNASK